MDFSNTKAAKVTAAGQPPAWMLDLTRWVLMGKKAAALPPYEGEKPTPAQLAAHSLLPVGLDLDILDTAATARKSLAGWMAAQDFYAKVLTTLNRRGIAPVVQKGIWLGAKFYPRPYWRTSADLDLLIEPHQLQPVDRLLRDLGCRPNFSALPGRQNLPAWVNENVIDCAEYQFAPFHVDVHINLLPRQLPHVCPLGWLWSQAKGSRLPLGQGATGANVAVRELPAELTLLHLAAHSTGHHFEMGLRGLLDMALLVASVPGGLDWQKLRRTAGDLRAEYLTLPALILLRHVVTAAQLKGFEGLESLAAWGGYEKAKRFVLRPGFLSTFYQTPRHLAPAGAVSSHGFLLPFQLLGTKRFAQTLGRALFISPKASAARYGCEPGSPKNLLCLTLRPLLLVANQIGQNRLGIVRALLRQ